VGGGLGRRSSGTWRGGRRCGSGSRIRGIGGLVARPVFVISLCFKICEDLWGFEGEVSTICPAQSVLRP
jgi:hypothetical protein